MILKLIKEFWWTVGDSNPRLPRCERGALPTELTALDSRELLATSIERKTQELLTSRKAIAIVYAQCTLIIRLQLSSYKERIVDFVCQEKWIVIEVDGGQHSIEKKRDNERDKWLKGQEYKVLRFESPSPDPSPQGRGN